MLRLGQLEASLNGVAHFPYCSDVMLEVFQSPDHAPEVSSICCRNHSSSSAMLFEILQPFLRFTTFFSSITADGVAAHYPKLKGSV